MADQNATNSAPVTAAPKGWEGTPGGLEHMAGDAPGQAQVPEREDQKALAREGEIVEARGTEGQRPVSADGDRTNDKPEKEQQPETMKDKILAVAAKVRETVRPSTEFEDKLAKAQDKVREQDQSRGR